MNTSLVKLGPKGQILLKKELREKFGLKPGCYIETIVSTKGILIKPIDTQKEFLDIHEIRKAITKHWPKDLDSVEAVREQRK